MFKPMACWRASLVAVLGGLPVTEACTMIAVGKDASALGAPMVGHSEDSGARTNDVRLVRVPRKQWPEGSMRPLYVFDSGYPRIVDGARSPDYAAVDGQETSTPLGYIPQVLETYGYWDTDYGVHNEVGLVIGESTCTAMTVGWPANVPYGYNKVGIAELSKIALERCATARCAAQTMGDLAVEHGFYSEDSASPEKPGYSGSSECLGLADATGELWVFNVLTGKNNASAIWAAQRMPSNAVVSIANSFTIRELDLNNSDDFLHSPNVTAFAEEMGWWSPSEAIVPGIFDFFSAYGYTPGAMGEPVFPPNVADLLSYYSGRRMWRIYSLLSPEEGAKLDPNKPNLPKTRGAHPAWVPAPAGSVTLGMVMAAYRDHYEGTDYDLTQGFAAGPFGNPNRGPVENHAVGMWERAISMYRTTWSFVNVARPDGRSLLWFGYDAPHSTVYLPFYGAATTNGPEGYHTHDGTMSKFSRALAYWPFNIIASFEDINYRLINADVRARAIAMESEALQQINSWEAQVASLDTDAALAVLSSNCDAFVEAKVAEWWDFAFSLFAKFGRMVVTYNDTDSGESMAGWAYPEWWANSAAVGYSTWTPSGPFHGVDDCLPSSNSQLSASKLTGSSRIFVAVGAFLAFLGMAVGLYAAGLRQGRQEKHVLESYMALP